MAGRDWNRLAEHVAARMKALGINTKAELARRTDLSAPTVRGVLDGKPRSGDSMSDESLLKLDRGLGWAPDSAAAILAGGEAAVAAPSAGGGGDLSRSDDGDVAALRHRVELLEQQTAKLRDDLTTSTAALRAALNAVEAAIGSPDHRAAR